MKVDHLLGRFKFMGLNWVAMTSTQYDCRSYLGVLQVRYSATGCYYSLIRSSYNFIRIVWYSYFFVFRMSQVARFSLTSVFFIFPDTVVSKTSFREMLLSLVFWLRRSCLFLVSYSLFFHSAVHQFSFERSLFLDCFVLFTIFSRERLTTL